MPVAIKSWIRTGGIILAIALIGLMVFSLGRTLGLRWDPFDLHQRRLERTQDELAEVRSDRLARQAEVEGARDQQVAQAVRAETLTSVARATATTLQSLKETDNDSTFLDTRLVDQLGDHDARLCELAPDLDGCASATDPARPR